jgi:hypothetical protein
VAYNSAIPWKPWKLTRWFKCCNGEYPAREGWYNTRVRGFRNSRGRRYWNGKYWSWPVIVTSGTSDEVTLQKQRAQSATNIMRMEWQGRLEQAGDGDWRAMEPTGNSVYPDTD